MQEKFYVFLDIDGTLWDYKNLAKRGKVVVGLNPESVQAVYALMDSLEQKYEAELVITSRRRVDWWSCLKFLKEQGFDIFRYNLHRTHLVNWKKPRGVKIAEYMYNDKIGKSFEEPKVFPRLFEGFLAKRENKKMKSNFVVIDDDLKPLKNYVLPENIIKTNVKNKSLDLEMVESFLNTMGLEIVDKQKYVHHEDFSSAREVEFEHEKSHAKRKQTECEKELGEE